MGFRCLRTLASVRHDTQVGRGGKKGAGMGFDIETYTRDAYSLG